MTDNNFDDICEQILEKILESKNYKPAELFEYIDQNLETWNIDILDYFLDENIDNNFWTQVFSSTY